MKIMCIARPCASDYIRRGWANAAIAAGHQWFFWSPETKPAFDAFREVEPDLFIGETWTLDRAIMKCIVSRPAMKVAMVASNYGPSNDEIDLNEYPILVANEAEVAAVSRLKLECGKPDVVFVHYHPNRIADTMGRWESKVGVKPIGMMSAFDPHEYSGGEFREEFKCDVGFVGAFWFYKGKNLRPYFNQLCYPIGKYNVKVFGNQPWGLPQYLGLIDTPDVKHLFNSATVCPNISEPHSTKFGFDIIERVWKVAGAGGFLIADKVASLYEDVFTDNEIVIAENTEDMLEKTRHYVDNPDDRKEYMRRGQEAVLAKHTYKHRMQDLFSAMGLVFDS